MLRTKNRSVIVVSGITHSGTNIVWNLLQSHPLVCGASLETGQLLYWKTSTSRLQRGAIRMLLPAPLFTRSPLFPAVAGRIDARLYEDKLLNLTSVDNRYASEGQPYSREQVTDSILCLKSVDRDVRLNPFFGSLYPGSHFVSVVRDPLAVCEGWIRRGNPPARVGKMFRIVAKAMLNDAARFGDRHMFLLFEDVLADPFGAAERLYKFADLEPQSLDQIRLKAKRTLSASGEHRAAYGEEDQKYWFDRSTIGQVLKPNVSVVQRERLTPEQRAEFEREAGPVLAELGTAVGW